MADATPSIQIYLVQNVEFIVSPVLVCHFMWVKQPQNLIKDLQGMFRSLNLLQSWNTLKCVAWENENLTFLFNIWKVSTST